MRAADTNVRVRIERLLEHLAGHLPLGTFDRDLGKLDGAQSL